MTEPPSDSRWVDLLDPDESALRAALPPDVHEITIQRILRPPRPGHQSRPRLEARGDYVFGVLSFPTVLHHDQICGFHEIDVIASLDRFVTIRKGDPVSMPPELRDARNTALRSNAEPGMCLHYLLDEISERFLDVVDRFDEEIDELEDRVPDWPSERVRTRSSSLRHELLEVRRVLAPTRDAARGVLDDRVELDGEITLFPREVELHFADTYDRLLARATTSSSNATCSRAYTTSRRRSSRWTRTT